MKSNRDLFTRVLPRFRQFSCFSFELELVPSDIFFDLINFVVVLQLSFEMQSANFALLLSS